MIGMIPLVGKRVYFLGKTLSGGREHPVSESQRRWAWAAEAKGELPEGKAYEWSKRVKGQHLPKHTKDFKPVKHANKAIAGMESAYGKKWRGGKPYPDTEEKTEPGNQVPYNQAHYDKQYSEAAKPQARPVGKSGNGVEDQSKRGSTGISEEEKDWDKQNRHPQSHAYNDETEHNVNAAKKNRGLKKAFPQPPDEGPMGADLPRQGAQPKQPRAPAAPQQHDDEDGPYMQRRTNPTSYRGVGMKALGDFGSPPKRGGPRNKKVEQVPGSSKLGASAFSPSLIGNPDEMGDWRTDTKSGEHSTREMTQHHRPGPGDKPYRKGILFIVRLFKAFPRHKGRPGQKGGSRSESGPKFSGYETPYQQAMGKVRDVDQEKRDYQKRADAVKESAEMGHRAEVGRTMARHELESDEMSTAEEKAEGMMRQADEPEQHKVGDDVHLGFGTKGGAGFRGKIHKIEGNDVHITNDEGRTFKGPMKHVSKAVQHPHKGRPGQVGGSTRMQMQNDYDRHPGPTQRHKLDDIERTHGVRNVKTNSKGTIVDFERGGEAERDESTPDDLDWVKRGDPSQRVKDIMKHHGR